MLTLKSVRMSYILEKSLRKQWKRQRWDPSSPDDKVEEWTTGLIILSIPKEEKNPTKTIMKCM